MDCTVHGIAKSQTQLSDFHFHFQNKVQRKQTERNKKNRVSSELCENMKQNCVN